MAGLWQIVGFDQVALPVKKHAHSKTTYDFRKKISIVVNSITAFTSKPLIYIFYLGLLISGLSVLYIICIIISHFLFSAPVTGWTSLIVSIWFLGGLILFCLGIIGIYLSKIFVEVKDRPYTVVKNILDKRNKKDD